MSSSHREDASTAACVVLLTWCPKSPKVVVGSTVRRIMPSGPRSRINMMGELLLQHELLCAVRRVGSRFRAYVNFM
ncbi:hypothetical protein CCMA1212_003604 [Trichoderma ghanense]|uniref:Secreted protein n=1 Tax=Trichoderma ghanense TaxID=65468 RepID=A0ABY2HA83_9HYPO